MTTTERDRHDLFLGLGEVLGEERATTLMEHLPRDGWRGLATTADLEHLEERLLPEIELRVERALREQTRAMIVANVANVVAIGSLVLAAAKL